MTSPPPSAADRFARLFGGPDPAVDDPSAARNARIRWVAAGLVVALVLATVVVVVARRGGPRYRTATVATRTVGADLTTVGTVEPVSQASVAFPASGTVASVAVKVGDTVTAGQALAALDPESLAQTLHAKEAALAQARLTLTQALAGQATTGVGTSGGGASALNASASTAGDTPRIVFASAPVSDPELAAAQQAVLDAQQKVDAATTAADGALADADTVCAGVTSTTTTTTTVPGGGDPYAACTQALKTAADAQHALALAQKDLNGATKALDTLLQQRLSTPTTTVPGGGGAPGGSGSSGAPGGSGGATGADTTGAAGGTTAGGFSGGGSSRSSTATAADLAAYQKSVDAAQAAVVVAQQSVDQATISSPIDGTVVAVNVAPGQSVTAGSSSTNVVVQGAGGFGASTYVGIDSIPRVKVGQAATVQPDGARRALDATVTSIGVAPDPTTTASTRYVVFLALADPGAHLNNGSTGTVTIRTAHATDALAVPTSAVTTDGKQHTVQVLRRGSPQAKTIEIGVTGGTWTEVTSGLKAGDRVVVADLGAPLPSSATTSSGSTQTNTGPALPGGFTNRGFTNGGTRRG